MLKKRYWTTQEALTFIRGLEPVVNEIGYSLAMAGSLVHGEEGVPRKDLDLIVFPLHQNKGDPKELHRVLTAQGLSLRLTVDQIQLFWRSQLGSDDTKHVEMWLTSEGKRIDLFLLK